MEIQCFCLTVSIYSLEKQKDEKILLNNTFFAVFKNRFLKVPCLTLAKYYMLQFKTTFVSLPLQGAGVAICVCAS